MELTQPSKQSVYYLYHSLNIKTLAYSVYVFVSYYPHNKQRLVP